MPAQHDGHFAMVVATRSAGASPERRTHDKLHKASQELSHIMREVRRVNEDAVKRMQKLQTQASAIAMRTLDLLEHEIGGGVSALKIHRTKGTKRATATLVLTAVTTAFVAATFAVVLLR